MSEQKYNTILSFLISKLKRLPILLLIRPLLKWSKQLNPQDGYSLIIACHYRVPEVLYASLKLLNRDDMPNLYETIITFDSPKTKGLIDFADRFILDFPELKISFFYQTRIQSMISQLIAWGWLDCWMSYVTGLSHVLTKVAMLHDMDAMILKKGLLENRYKEFIISKMKFMGYRWYKGNGITLEMKIPYIVEMFLDVQYIRDKFRPIDLFNKITKYQNTYLDFDTFLYPISQTKNRTICEISEIEMVHPSQVISQYTYLMNKKEYLPPASNNMFFIPYFNYVASSDYDLYALTKIINSDETQPENLPFIGHRMNMSRLSTEHFRWVTKQIFRIEYSLSGTIREEVLLFLNAIASKLDNCSCEKFFLDIETELKNEKHTLSAQFHDKKI